MRLICLFINISIFRAEISHWNAMLKELRDEKERIVAMQGNELARFGASVPQIVSLINENAAQFSKKPIGPIGKFKLLSHSFSHNCRNLCYC